MSQKEVSIPTLQNSLKNISTLVSELNLISRMEDLQQMMTLLSDLLEEDFETAPIELVAVVVGHFPGQMLHL